MKQYVFGEGDGPGTKEVHISSQSYLAEWRAVKLRPPERNDEIQERADAEARRPDGGSLCASHIRIERTAAVRSP
jgi:hypothetical protein